MENLQYLIYRVFLLLSKALNILNDKLESTDWSTAMYGLWEGYKPHWTAEAATIGALILIGVIVVSIVLTKKGVFKFRQGLALSLLTGYCILMFGTTVICRDAGNYQTPNYIFLWEYYAMIRNHSWQMAEYIVLNIAMLMPVGFLIPIVIQRRRFIWPVLAAFACSLCIELLQYYLMRGMFEIDDIFNNTLGGWLGYLVYWVITFIPYHAGWSKRERRRKRARSGRL